MSWNTRSPEVGGFVMGSWSESGERSGFGKMWKEFELARFFGMLIFSNFFAIKWFRVRRVLPFSG